MTSNRNVLKRYAPQARLDFIQAVTNRAAQFGIAEDGNDAGEVQGELFILNGRAFPRLVANQRARLISRIACDGFAQTMEAIAYTWFNRFLAIRYMELHGYLPHGLRVLSSLSDHAEPEILEKATSVELPGLDLDGIVNLKLDGTKDEQIYRKLLIAQCNDLHRAMPFLFEKIDDETELLLPENLLQSDSIVRRLVNEIAEEEWQEIEIIGWLYQYYISEKKDQVIGKVVKSEDIPAATQLFTPNWIVKYMVQNSLGAQWLATYPDSGIRAYYPMEYYIAPAEQTPEVQAQIDAITPKQLDPEAITLIDPAVGSGHILVEAYDLFRAIYLERGYTKREAARAILTKNLFGLDIDDRAAQMAGFALLMKACADDRTVLRNPPKLNVLPVQDSEGIDAEALAKALLPPAIVEMVPSGDLLPETLSQPPLSAQQAASKEAEAIKALVDLFHGAKTYGSLIKIPDILMENLSTLDRLLSNPLSGDLLQHKAQEEAQEALKPLVKQARLLGGRYNCVVANPPYMGRKHFNTKLKSFSARAYKLSKQDLYAMFMARGFDFLQEGGYQTQVNIPNWMFLSTFTEFRRFLTEESVISSVLHNGRGVFGSDFGSVSFALRKIYAPNFVGKYYRLFESSSKISSEAEIVTRFEEATPFLLSGSQIKRVPGRPIAYWIDESVRKTFEKSDQFASEYTTRKGMVTANNDIFVRNWTEVSIDDLNLNSSDRSEAKESGKKWFPYIMGGEFRRWYGNRFEVVNWKNDGQEIRTKRHPSENRVWATNFNDEYIFRPNINWSGVSMYKTAFRYSPGSELFASTGLAAFWPEGTSPVSGLCYLNSSAAEYFLKVISPTLSANPGDIGRLPIPKLSGEDNSLLAKISKRILEISRTDWDYREDSWDFAKPHILDHGVYASSLEESYERLTKAHNDVIEELRSLEQANNKIFVEACGISEVVTTDVPSRDISLTCNPAYRYGGDSSDAERVQRLKSDTMRELISYAVGCIMGRYSLAEPGLIYACSGGEGFDLTRYGPFPADEDGIVPLTEEQWFADDAAARIEEFFGIAWPEVPILETMTTLMDGLSIGKAGEPRTVLRSYLSKQFYKDHLQTYKKRPLYWLFSSGKQKAFEALVYLHRYNEGTLARMRTVYVTPLMGKLQQRTSDLDAEISASSSSAEKTRKTRERDKLSKQLVELREFDEELRHLADQRISLDLDEGVKFNYARFGNLLAAKDVVCPKKKAKDK